MKALFFILSWFPLIFMIAVLLLAIFFYWRGGQNGPRRLKILAWSAVAIYLLLSAAKTAAQYLVWSQDEMGKFFLPPHQPLDYFLSYSLLHFWYSVLIAVILALVYYLFFKFIGKKRPDLFVVGEVELAFITALLSGWPGFVLYLPLVFIFALLHLAVTRVLFKKDNIALGLSFILAAVTVIIWGSFLIKKIGLGVLVI